MHATWAPHEKHGQLTAKADLPDTVFAFPKQRKEPLTDAKHVRNAVARFDKVARRAGATSPGWDALLLPPSGTEGSALALP